jgi:hypothetical protein
MGHVIASTTAAASSAAAVVGTEQHRTKLPASIIAASCNTLLASLHPSVEESLLAAAAEGLCVIARADVLPLLPGFPGSGPPVELNTRHGVVYRLGELARPGSASLGGASSSSRPQDAAAAFAVRQSRALMAMGADASPVRRTCIACLGAIAASETDHGVRDAAVEQLLALQGTKDNAILTAAGSALVEACAGEEPSLAAPALGLAAAQPSLAGRILDHCLTVLVLAQSPEERYAGATWALALLAALGARQDVLQRWTLAQVTVLHCLKTAAPGSPLAQTCGRCLALAFDETMATLVLEEPSSTDGGETESKQAEPDATVADAASAGVSEGLEASLVVKPFSLRLPPPSRAAMVAAASLREPGLKLDAAALERVLQSVPSTGSMRLLLNLARHCGDGLLFFSLASLVADPPPPPQAVDAARAAMAAGADLRTAPSEAILPLVLHYLRAVACIRCMPFLPLLVPRLVRALHDPRSDVRRTAHRVWAGLTAEPATALATFAPAILADACTAAMDGSDWRERAAALLCMPGALASATTAAVTGLTGRLWSAAVAGLCDPVEDVTRAASSVAAALTRVTSRLCSPDVAGPEPAKEALGGVLCVLLGKGIDAPYPHARHAALRAVVAATAAAGSASLPWAGSVCGAVLDALPGLEKKEVQYLQSHANAGGNTALDMGSIDGTRLEVMRLSAARDSEVWQAVQAFSAIASTASVAELRAPAVSPQSWMAGQHKAGDVAAASPSPAADLPAHSSSTAIGRLLHELAVRCSPSRSLLTKGGAAMALRDVVSAMGFSAAPFVGPAMAILVGGGGAGSSALADPSDGVRRAVGSALAQMARVAAADGLQALIGAVLELATGSRAQLSASESARAAWSLPPVTTESASPEQAESVLLADTGAEASAAAASAVLSLARALSGDRLDTVRAAFLPLAFVGMHRAAHTTATEAEADAEAAVSRRWSDAVEELVPGALRAALRDAAPRIVVVARQELQSRTWARRRAGASALAAIIRMLRPRETAGMALHDGVSGAAFSPSSSIVLRATKDARVAKDSITARLDRLLPVTVAPAATSLLAETDATGLLAPRGASGQGGGAEASASVTAADGRLRRAGGSALGMAVAVPELAGRATGPLGAALAALSGRWWQGKEAVLDAALVCLSAEPEAILDATTLSLSPSAISLCKEATRAAARASDTDHLIRACALRIAASTLITASAVAASRRDAKGSEHASPSSAGPVEAAGSALSQEAAGSALSAAAKQLEANCGRLGLTLAGLLGTGVADSAAAEPASASLSSGQAALVAAGLQALTGACALMAVQDFAEDSVLTASQVMQCCTCVMSGRSPGAGGVPVAAPGWSLRCAAAQAAAALAALVPSNRDPSWVHACQAAHSTMVAMASGQGAYKSLPSSAKHIAARAGQVVERATMLQT